MAPDLVAEFVAEFRKTMQEERQEAIASRATQQSRLKTVTAEIGNIVNAIANDIFHVSITAKMDALEAERAEIETRPAETPEPDPVALHPGISEIYRRKALPDAPPTSCTISSIGSSCTGTRALPGTGWRSTAILLRCYANWRRMNSAPCVVMRFSRKLVAGA